MRSTMASAAVVRPLKGCTPSNKAHNNQLILCDGAAPLKYEKNYLLTIIDWVSRRQRCAGDDNAVLLRRCGTTTKTTSAPRCRAPPRIVVIPPKDIVVRRVVGKVQLGALTDVDVASGVVLHNVAPAPIVATRARRIAPPPCRPPDPCPRRPRPPH
jgi:hypothetical protein